MLASLMPIRDLLFAILIPTIWGFSFVAIKEGVADTPPLLLTAMRFFFAAVPAIFFLERPKVRWRYLLVFGVMLGVVQFGLVNVAIKLGMPTGLTSIIMQIQVFYTIGLAFFVFRERPRIWQTCGGGLAFIGMGIIGASKSEGVTLIPFLMLLLAAFAWSIANITSKMATRERAKSENAGRINMFAFVAWASLVAPVPLLIGSLVLEDHARIMESLTHPTFGTIWSTAYLAWPATIIAYGLWNRLLGQYSAASVTPFALLVPIEGFIAGHIIYGEPFGGLALVGSAMVFAGLVLSVFGGRWLGDA